MYGKYRNNAKFLKQVFSTDYIDNGKAHHSQSPLVDVAATIASEALAPFITPFTDRFGAKNYPFDEPQRAKSESGLITTKVTNHRVRNSDNRMPARFRKTTGKKKPGRKPATRKRRPAPKRPARRNYPAKFNKKGRAPLRAPQGAPINTSLNVVGGSTSFSSGRRAGCVRLHSRTYLNTLNYTAAGGTVWVPGTALAIDIGGQWYFNPTNQVYVNRTPTSGISGYFDTYYLLSARLIYTTRLPTTSDLHITWGNTPGVDYWQTLGIPNGTATPAKEQVLQLSNSISFGAWTPRAALELKVDSSKMFYIRGPDGNGTPFNYSDSIADQRMSYATTAGVIVEGTPPASGAIPVGDMFVEYDIELCDVGSYFASSPTLSISARIKEIEAKLASAPPWGTPGRDDSDDSYFEQHERKLHPTLISRPPSVTSTKKSTSNK